MLSVTAHCFDGHEPLRLQVISHCGNCLQHASRILLPSIFALCLHSDKVNSKQQHSYPDRLMHPVRVIRHNTTWNRAGLMIYLEPFIDISVKCIAHLHLQYWMHLPIPGENFQYRMQKDMTHCYMPHFTTHAVPHRSQVFHPPTFPIPFGPFIFPFYHWFTLQQRWQ